MRRLRAAVHAMVGAMAWGVVVGGVHGTSPTQGARTGLLLFGPLVLLSLRGPHAPRLETPLD